MPGLSSATLSARERLILAVDVATADEARALIDDLQDLVGVFKIGLELFTSSGGRLVSELRESGLKVFLDCKFHDIPNQVAGAARSAVDLGVDMFTVHASGGAKMLQAAAKAVAEGSVSAGNEPLLLGVTVLTSLSAEELRDELKVERPLAEHVLGLAELCVQSGLPGIVASPQEVRVLRERFGKEIKLVIPGTRPSWADSDDQSRVMTPAQAIKSGADYLVVGRPITKAKDRKDAAKRLIEEVQSAI